MIKNQTFSQSEVVPKKAMNYPNNHPNDCMMKAYELNLSNNTNKVT